MAEFDSLPQRVEIDSEHEQQLQEAFNKYGMAGMKQYFEDSLEEWKDVPICIAVTGRSGVGKSSFINAIRGLTAEDPGAAKVGVTETTTDVQQYPHPLNPQLVLCDLPGVGTPSFSKATYFTDKRIGFDSFDLFLIMTADRFMEDDLWMAKGIKERGKGFLFIRTKIDQDVENEKKARKAYYKSNPKAIEELVFEVRKNCEENLREFFSDRKGTQRIFLIDSFECENTLYDFDVLSATLINNFPALKRDAFILSMTALTPSIIDAKGKVLRSRMWKVCALSALGGAIPVPGVSLVLDAGIVLNEAKFYRTQLGLDDAKLKEVAKCMELPWELFKDGAKLRSLAVSYTKSGIAQFCSYLVVSEGIESAFELAIPVIGSIVGAAISAGSTKFTLEKILGMMIDDAKRLNEYIKEQSMSTTMI